VILFTRTQFPETPRQGYTLRDEVGPSQESVTGKNMLEEKKIVMISSTARDLPEHREEVMNACIRMGMFPVMMEHLSASEDAKD
jgi:hypothetical protein